MQPTQLKLHLPAASQIISMPKILNQEKSAAAEPSLPKAEFSLIPIDKLFAIYSAMVHCRMIEQRASQLLQQGKVATDFGGSDGREASASALVIDLQPEDALSLAFNDLMPAFVKGLGIETLFRTISKNAANVGRSGEFASANLIAAGPSEKQAKALCEFAVNAKSTKLGRIALAFLYGEAANAQEWNELMVLAGSHRLPIVFVHHCDSSSAEFAPPKTSGKSAPSALVHGIPAIVVDGGDAVALYRVGSEAITRARQDRGATLVQCLSFPATNDSETERIYKEGEIFVLSPPVLAMEAYLRRKALLGEGTRCKIISEFTSELDLATRFLND
jgi:TPP-dependent pyruvate/acetoin dehydrogenase alpha subunit